MARHFLDRNAGYDSSLPTLITRVGLFGWSGVDLFFVLSGFLIFSIIFEQEARGAFSWNTFYLKRCLRIWPAYFASLGVCIVAGQFPVGLDQLAYFALFLQNYAGPLSAVNGGVYWSIAVEEHFYIVAPILLVASTMFRRQRSTILIALVLAPLLIRCVVYFAVARGDMYAFYHQIYFPTHARFDSLAIGVLCAHVVRHHRETLRRANLSLPAIAAFLLAAAVVTTGTLNWYSQHPSFLAGVVGFSLTALFWASILLIGETFRIFDRLGRGLLRVIAHLSYSMYLYHIMALELWGSIFHEVPTTTLSIMAHATAYAATTVLFGGLSYMLVERYFLLLKQNLSQHKRLSHHATPVERKLSHSVAARSPLSL